MLGYDTRQIDTTNETVVDDKPLRSVLARSLNRKDLDLVDEFLKHHGCENLHRHKLSYCSDKTARGILCGIKTVNLVLQLKHLS